MMSDVNPVTLETIKNRLITIGREMVSTMVRTAGTPIYAEIKDFSCGLFDYQARQVVYSGMAVMHNLAVQNLIQTSIRLHGDDSGIFDGDVFMGNDPYLGGGIHALELGLASPIFVDGKIIAWSGSIAHQLDIGGMSPGGFCMDATDCFQEGIRFPPVKLFRGGELQRDIWNIHRNNVRLPDKIGMELKGQIAANNAAKKRVKELVSKFGVETFRKTCEALVQLSARVTEERIRQIPEGLYEHADFEEIEGIGDGIFTIHCDLTVHDGKLIFDFTRECPPQLPKLLNSTQMVVEGVLYSFLMPVLCHDIPWNEGCTYPIRIVTKPGSILNAQPPAPCSSPHVAFRAADAGLGAFNKAFVHSPLKERLSACWTSSPPVTLGVVPGGTGRPPIMIPLLEGMAGGGGAFSGKDGLDVCASNCVMEYSMGDVEAQENAYPILYLTRRIMRDSGGAGRYRGGCGVLVAVIPHKAPGVRFSLVEDRRLVPSHGFMGGYPGASHHWLVGRQIDVSRTIREGLGDDEEIFSKMELASPITVLDQGPEDVFVFNSSGGGGIGDPLNRDPEKVARDVLWNFESRKKAKVIYGVVFKPGTLDVDETQTKQVREKIRADRILDGTKVESNGPWQDKDYVILESSTQGFRQLCSRCGRILAPSADNWKKNVIHRELRMDETGMRIPGDQRVILRQYICPDCGLILDCEVTLRGMEPFRDFSPIK
ncbi:MAG: hydantoinase B/oxoprolinase family protein [Deltaproteobacteria bacterium]|nr:hydantoinase B/oxoprolinase family protein [Deltaproteobacteria bacterium]